MIEIKVCYYLFLLTFLESASQIRPSFHGHNNAFVQDDNDVQYLLDNIPISMHKGFASSVQGAGDSASDDKNIQGAIPYIQFEPNVLIFKERQLGIPHQETVTLFNRDGNRTIHLSSISGSTQHFHSSFFQDKVIPPLGNTTFNVVFLGREEGEIDSHLFIHTSEGTLKYPVKGTSVSSPYRLRPVVGVKLPLNASFTPLIYMHNPHSEAMQVVEVYSSGGEFQLELPSGEAEGPRELWAIPPYQTKPVIRLHFNAYMEKNHTAYVRFKVNNSAEIMVVAVEVEVGSGAGLHWGGSSASINLGMGGSLHSPTHYPIALRNSAKKPVKVLNIISTPVSKALRIDFEPVVIPGDTDVPITIGTLIYDWKAGLETQHFKGKLMIKGIGPGGSSQKLAIPWSAEVLQGGLEINSTVGHYCSPHSNQPRNFSVVNRFKIPLAITNVSFPIAAKSFFGIRNFHPRVLKPGQRANIFSLVMHQEKKNENIKLESSIFIYSNVSTTEVPLLSYDGKLRKIIPGERESDRGTMNFGTVGSGTENEAIFALENQNPVNIELHGWGVNMPGAVLELMGCQNGPTELFNKGFRNITVCSHTGNQSIKPGYLAIFKIKVKTPMVEEDTIVGDVFVRTTYERLTVPVYMRVAHGRISLKKLTFTDCFPGSICLQQVKIHSTFARPMEVTCIAPVHKDNRVKYIALEESSLPIISKGENHIGAIQIDPSISCKQQCYLGLSMNTSAGNQWLNTMSLPSHTRDSDLNLLNARYTRYLNATGGSSSWDNITMRLDTTEVRGHKFFVNIKLYWPSLIVGSSSMKNKSLFTFPLTQVGNTSYKIIKLHNPSTKPLLVQLVMDQTYPQGMRLYHSLPNKFKPICLECPPTVDGEFKFDENEEDRASFERQWDVTTAQGSLPLYINPGETRSVRLSYTPTAAAWSSGLLFIRNNMTILEVIRLISRGAHAQFKFGNRKPGSTTPLLFELAEKHLKDCERERSRRNPVPNLTVKRSFTARNTGELPIDIHGFYINGLLCEGYGFKVLNCGPFKLSPNATKKIEIAFTPDFTLSRVERELLILTSLGAQSTDTENSVNENGMVRLSLLTTVPGHTLESCAAVLIRPTWEPAVQFAAISLPCILLMCILAVSFLEADRILRGALATLSKTSPVQPPLDLRQLAQSAGMMREKTASEEKPKIPRKDESLPDWSLMNVKRNKEKEAGVKSLKIPDWSSEEERRFKLDTEFKELPVFTKNKNDDSGSTLDCLGTNEVSNTANIAGKKKNAKRQNSASEVLTTESSICLADNSPTDTIINADKKTVTNISSTKSSPTASRKGKSNNSVTSLPKEDFKFTENEVPVDSSFSNNPRDSKSDTKRKQSNGNTTAHNNHSSYKKYEATTSQKPVQFSEEETSSTTTESSVHDDPAPYKDEEHTYAKPEKVQRKPIPKKNKPQAIPAAVPIDYRDNYEGDCDDDDYDKERQENPNRWKTNVNRSGTKHHHHHQSRNPETASYKSPRPNKNPPRKDKSSQKRRSTEKVNVKSVNSMGAMAQREDIRPSQVRVPSPVPPPPPSCWGENRARFSDVVARNPESVSPAFSISGKTTTKSHEISHELWTNLNRRNLSSECTERLVVQESCSSPIEYTEPVPRTPSHVPGIPMEQDNVYDADSPIVTQAQQQSNSYFINTFSEPPFEPELVPYDDLPETNEPLVELESLEEDTRSQLWGNKSPIIDLISDNTATYRLETPKHVDKLATLPGPLKDNWVTVKTNWEPLYTRGAVGEERSGVWGVNTGGVWAAAPWGAPPPPLASSLQPSTSSQHTEPDSQDRSGFDPFRSLSTIWTPSSTNPWKMQHEE
ncbi:transmembrane protein 131 [Venturia canescens]|uniref:transmembrane protein 131 n=1 Tax=Venturia canescens TaxID=32260 RepID=UPI001C9C5AA3|nr:transmembrane protein 131 [Venturia canescens]